MSTFVSRLQWRGASTSAATGTLTHIAVAGGGIALILFTLPAAHEVAGGWIVGVLCLCLSYFIYEWMSRVVQAMAEARIAAYLASVRGVIDTLAALAVPLALTISDDSRAAWMFSALWLLKIAPDMSGLRVLRRVAVIEASALLSVFAIFLLILFLASTLMHTLERDAQPAAFGSLPATLWWAVTTLTTTGYGDVVPVTPLGRVLAGAVMICGVGVFGLWTGILATGFAAEMRRSNSIKTWEYVSKVPFFSQLGPAAITDVTHMLRGLDLPPQVTVIKKGTIGDCMYFIASGEVEVELPDKRVKLGEGAFFGELALLENSTRSANVITSKLSELLVLDLVDFRVLMARHPDLAKAIEDEATRRQRENAVHASGLP